MTDNHDEIGDIPDYEANEPRSVVRKVLDNHIDEFIDRSFGNNVLDSPSQIRFVQTFFAPYRIT